MAYILVIWMFAGDGTQVVQAPYTTLAACEQAGHAWDMQVNGVRPHHICLPHQ